MTFLLFVAGCAGAPAAAPRTQVHLEPVRSSAPDPTPLPGLPSLSGAASLAGGAEPRLTELSAVNQDVSVVVRQLAARFGLQYQIDPAVRGTVNTTLRNKTLSEALAAIIPQGITYQIQNGVLRVGPARMTTRIFSMDYVAISRFGTASTVIQRRLGTTGGGGIAGAGGGGGAALAGAAQAGGAGVAGLGGGADVISATSVADAWEEIKVAIEGLIFDALPTGQQQAQQAPGAGLAGGIGGRPYSRVALDGRRVIINPMAGTITVSAFPAQLEQVEIFIRTFESSIQRQVLIEAKIVEVNLDRSFEFGIDWNVLARAGTSSLSIRTTSPPLTSPTGAAGRVEFTLSGGPGEITAVLNALSSQGDVRVLSSPRVSALNNQRAVFDVTTGEIVFTLNRTPVLSAAGTPTGQFISEVTPTQVNVGIVLDVLPQIGADNTVTMNIRPVVTSVARTATFTADGNTFSAPVIDTRESDTMARLRASETIIIGGLMQTRREKVQSGIPGLRSIPLLGRLFTSYKDVERKAELVIFLTPTIISGQPSAGR
jgi:MSHA type pilus biogenesis protein MshL